MRMDNNPSYTCALCGANDGLHPGGQASQYPLCHRDHSKGTTCYEKVTRRQGVSYDTSFGATIEALQKAEHTAFGKTLRQRAIEEHDQALEELVKYLEDQAR